MKTVHVFLGVDMRMGHDGLHTYAKKRGIEIDELPDFTACVFISRNKMRIKAYAYNGVLSYVRSKDNRRPFDIKAIDSFPRAFSRSGTMQYEAALKHRLRQVLNEKGLLEDDVL